MGEDTEPVRAAVPDVGGGRRVFWGQEDLVCGTHGGRKLLHSAPPSNEAAAAKPVAEGTGAGILVLALLGRIMTVAISVAQA